MLILTLLRSEHVVALHWNLSLRFEDRNNRACHGTSDHSICSHQKDSIEIQKEKEKRKNGRYVFRVKNFRKQKKEIRGGGVCGLPALLSQAERR